MDQVSRPLQILLVGALLLGAAWLLVLRPKGDSGSSSPAKPAAAAPAHPTSTSPAHGPGASLPGGLGRAVTKARGAAGQSDAANHNLQQATGGGTASTPARPATPVAPPATAVRRPATGPTATGTAASRGAGARFSTNNAAASSLALAAGMFAAGFTQAVGGKLAAASATRVTVAHGPVRITARPAQGVLPTPKATSSPAAVQAAMANGKVVALLFWNGNASDDRSVREEFAHVSSHAGQALLVSAPVRQVSLFSASIRGIQVLQSPTIVVVDRRHQARTLTGYTERDEIGQAVDSALLAR